MPFFVPTRDEHLHKAADVWADGLTEETQQKLLQLMSRLQSGVRVALKDQAQGILAELENMSPVEMLALMNDPQGWKAFREKLEDALRARLLPAAQLGQEDAGKELSRWTRFNLPFEQAQVWARDHAAELVTAVDDHTRAVLRDEINAALRQGVTPLALRERIETVLGDSTDYRAARIAETEVMTAYRQGAHEAFKASDAVWGEEWVAGQSGMCRVCQSLNGQKVKLGQSFRVTVDGKEHVIPPGQQAHPHCRCRSKPITYGQMVRNELIEIPTVKRVEMLGPESYNKKLIELNNGRSAFGFVNDGVVYLSPDTADKLMEAMRRPQNFSIGIYGNALKTYIHEQAHALREPVNKGVFDEISEINEGLSDLWSKQNLNRYARSLGFDGEVVYWGNAYPDEQLLVENLLKYSPESMEIWMKTPAPDLLRRVAMDVGKEKASEVEKILRSKRPILEKLEAINIVLRP